MIHTKRHSGEDPSKLINKNEPSSNLFADFGLNRGDKLRNPSEELSNSLEEVCLGIDSR